MSIKLTRKQSVVLSVIAAHHATHGKCPTYQAVGNMTGRSKHAAWKMCQNIMMRGYLRSDLLGKLKLEKNK
tara:strand:+ start:254 stop:466 length:213 start_codon:yes stop_codon:yes gene_type:complete